ncbi:type II secretion system F family protein [Allomesorhizobium camelthorni]|uniref:Type II secretion system F family protein n=1 Tax=Allomesorhizobium camelthorni TaxID=475069 RepID=A0A6G4WB49_9HYPH|nr:type II secretion system F family protein [Mesorhizobium camelthorni]NGO51433.1 type II secretion system F family protein [Mesorhizobium camelthorni]
METLIVFLAALRPTSLAPVALLLLVLGGAAVVWPLLAHRGGRSDVKRRLKVEADIPVAAADATPKKKSPGVVREKAMKTAHDFYAKSDPENVARLRMRLIRAGHMDPSAVGKFFLIRFVGFAVGAIGAFLADQWMGGNSSAMSRWAFVIMAGGAGYFFPGLALSRQISVKMREYRNGFPDFMDLMIVCSDAGMSMEAGIERVAKELFLTYPSLSQNLTLVSLELRAGRSLDDALKSLSDRLSLEEVRSFATLLQQSKELGTSLSGALRVFSDEMRHKRMSMAEEKAHALPAKMSVPVTVCILPVVLMVAIIPVIVKMSMTGE